MSDEFETPQYRAANQVLSIIRTSKFAADYELTDDAIRNAVYVTQGQEGVVTLRAMKNIMTDPMETASIPGVEVRRGFLVQGGEGYVEYRLKAVPRRCGCCADRLEHASAFLTALVCLLVILAAGSFLMTRYGDVIVPQVLWVHKSTGLSADQLSSAAAVTMLAALTFLLWRTCRASSASAATSAATAAAAKLRAKKAD